jgi:hypothetical protein
LPQRVILHHQRNAEGGENRGERIAAEQRTQGRNLQSRADQCHDERGKQQREPETAGRGDHDYAHIGAEHEQLAVGKVDHVHDAEDERQSRGDQRQDHPGDDAVQRLDEQLLVGKRLEKSQHGAHATLPDTAG